MVEFMTYKKLLAPAGKQQRLTITRLGFEPETELIILSIDDYKRLNLKDNKDLLEIIDKQKETIETLENDKKELLKEKDELNKSYNNLLENNNRLNDELQANRINKNRLDSLEKEILLFKENINDKLNNLVLNNENQARDLLIKLDNEYKNISFWDRLLNRMSNTIDLTKYEAEIKKVFNNELENTKNNLFIANENIGNYNRPGVIAPDDEQIKY